jgi:hypothetical protein
MRVMNEEGEVVESVGSTVLRVRDALLPSKEWRIGWVRCDKTARGAECLSEAVAERLYAIFLGEDKHESEVGDAVKASTAL